MGRKGITTEADQRHVREIMKDLGLEQANCAAIPSNVDRKNENNSGSDGCKGENQCERAAPDQTRLG